MALPADAREELQQFLAEAALTPGVSVELPPDLQAAVAAELFMQGHSLAIRRRGRHNILELRDLVICEGPLTS